MVVNSMGIISCHAESRQNLIFTCMIIDILSYRHLHLITFNLNQLLVFKAKLLPSKRFQLYPGELNPSSKATLYGENMSGENVSLVQCVPECVPRL